MVFDGKVDLDAADTECILVIVAGVVLDVVRDVLSGIDFLLYFICFASFFSAGI